MIFGRADASWLRAEARPVFVAIPAPIMTAVDSFKKRLRFITPP